MCGRSHGLRWWQQRLTHQRRIESYSTSGTVIRLLGWVTIYTGGQIYKPPRQSAHNQPALTQLKLIEMSTGQSAVMLRAGAVPAPPVRGPVGGQTSGGRGPLPLRTAPGSELCMAVTTSTTRFIFIVNKFVVCL